MGSVRMTIQTQAVLGALLTADGEVYGLQVVRASGLAAGTVYPILQRLLAMGWIVARWEPAEQAQAEGRPPRRYYELSPEGTSRAYSALHSARHRGNLSRLLDLIDPGNAALAE
jgi:PadR family transcriptional regulator, regulatory protein PadR